MKQSCLHLSVCRVGLNDKNVFPPFFSRIYAFYQASRFKDNAAINDVFAKIRVENGT